MVKNNKKLNSLKRVVEAFFIALIFLIMLAPVVFIFPKWKTMNIAEFEAVEVWLIHMF